METKDLMWAVWCLIAAFGAYKIGYWMGIQRSFMIGKAVLERAFREGKFVVPDAKQPQAK